MTAWALVLVLAAAPEPEPLGDVAAAIPDAVVALGYATPDNFMKKQVYPAHARCLLAAPVLKRLVVAADALRARGYRLKLRDCYRPRSVQWELWKVLPKPGYVADPRKGSNHNRGAAVDLELVTLDGGAVEFPTPWDTFGKAAHHGYAGGSAASRAHRKTLREAMVAAGFSTNRMEWWHYDVKDPARFPLRDEPFVAADAVDAGTP